MAFILRSSTFAISTRALFPQVAARFGFGLRHIQALKLAARLGLNPKDKSNQWFHDFVNRYQTSPTANNRLRVHKAPPISESHGIATIDEIRLPNNQIAVLAPDSQENLDKRFGSPASQISEATDKVNLPEPPTINLPETDEPVTEQLARDEQIHRPSQTIAADALRSSVASKPAGTNSGQPNKQNPTKLHPIAASDSTSQPKKENVGFVDSPQLSKDPRDTDFQEKQTGQQAEFVVASPNRNKTGLSSVSDEVNTELTNDEGHITSVDVEQDQFVKQSHITPSNQISELEHTLANSSGGTQVALPAIVTRPSSSDEIGDDNADALFVANKSSNRSIQSWASRLSGSNVIERTESKVAPQAESFTNVRASENKSEPGQTQSQRNPLSRLQRRLVMSNPLATPQSAPNQVNQDVDPDPVDQITLSSKTRRFIHASVGVDPVDIPIISGSVVDAAIDEAHADALTDGQQIYVGRQVSTNPDRPQELGLIAHEMTHVARRRTPRFIPPVIRNVINRGSTSYVQDEENIAESVERQVSSASRAMPTDGIADVTQTPNVQEAKPVARSWGKLPSPWEPMPKWFERAFDAKSNPSDQQNEVAQPRPKQNNIGAISTMANSLGDGEAFMKADQTRNSRSASALPASVGNPKSTVSPSKADMDALARQVYEILKRRLAAEYRRELF